MTSESVDEQIAALRRELKITWESHAREHSLHELAHAREHEFAAEAVRTAATLAKENKADANEWRAAMTDRESRFAVKAEVISVAAAVEALKTMVIDRLERIERADLVRDTNERAGAIERQKDQAEIERRAARNQWIAGVAITFIVIVINLAIRLATEP